MDKKKQTEHIALVAETINAERDQTLRRRGVPTGHDLRKQAEEIMGKKTALSLEDLQAISPEETLRILHELQVHQIELEMQNEELHRMQVELDATRSRYFDLYDLAPVSYININERGQIVEANLAAATLLGLPRSALVGNWISRFILREYQDIYYAFRKQLVETGEPQRCEVRVAKNDQPSFWARLSATTAHDFDGTAEYHIELSDITEQKQVGDALVRSEDLFQQLFESDSAIKLILDAETGNIVDANQAAMEFYGWPIEELKEMRIQQINTLPPEAVKAAMAQAAASERTSFEFHHRRADGSIREVEVFSNKVETGGRSFIFSIIHDITERKLTEEALRKSEERHRVLAKTMLQGVVHQDAEGRVIEMNPAAENILGRNREQFPAGDVVQAEHYPLRENGERFPGPEHPSLVALRTGLPERDVIMGVFNPRLGEYRWLSIDAIPVYSPGEVHPSEVYTVFEDITERKQTDEAIRRHNAILEGINEVLATALTCRTEEELGESCLAIARKLTQSKFGFIGHINDKGLTDIAISNPGWEACAHIDPQGHRTAALNFKIHGIYGRVISSGKAQFTNDPANHPDRIGLPAGHPPLESFLGAPLVREGRIVGMIAVANRSGGYSPVEQEILTALTSSMVEAFMRKRIEEALHLSEARFRMLFTTMIEGFCVIEVLFNTDDRPIDFRILEINPAFETQAGLQNVQGRLISELMPEIEPYWFEIFGKVAKTGKPVRFTNEVKALDRWFDVSAYKLDGRESRKVAILFNDITKRKQAEEQLLCLNNDLEKRVEQRTQELQETQKQYLHVEKLSAIGKLSASIAHEFNNPLQGILSVMKGLKRRAILEEEDRMLLDEAIEEGNRVKELIRSLQEFNRPSSGRKTTVDIHQSLESVLLLQKSELRGKRISVVLKFAEQLPQIQVVPDQIKQVFLNLLANAADACQRPGGVITVSTRQEDEERVAVAIQDNGRGIDPSAMELIFQPFYTTKPEIKGTGLGLSVSYGIVRHHQGEIRVNSRPGEGATFTVLLPIKGVDAVS